MLNRIEAKLNCLLHFFRIESPYVSALESNRQCGRGAETINEKAPRRGRGSRCRASLPRGRARCYAGGIEVTEQERQFLIGLEKLTRETGVCIYGCSDCGSPWLGEPDISDDRSGYAYLDGFVQWVAPSNKWDWKRYGDTVVK